MKPPRLLRNDALSDVCFWAMHYYLLIGTEDTDTDEFIEPFFGVSNSAVNDYFVSEFDSSGPDEVWPYLQIPVCNGFSVEVEYAGSTSETRFYISHAEWEQPICLGHDSGHFALPAFRWSEAAAIRRAGNGIDAARALLLIFPSIWLVSEDDTIRARSALIHAWRSLGVARQEHLEEMVQQIVNRCTYEIHWWQDSRLGWVNDGRHSFRNPETLMTRFDEDRFTKVSAFFAGIESHD